MASTNRASDARNAVEAVGEALLDIDRSTPSQRYAAEALGVPMDSMTIHLERLSPLLGRLVGVLLSRTADEHELTPVDWRGSSFPARQESLTLSDGEIGYFSEPVLHWPGGTLADVPLVTKLFRASGTEWTLIVNSGPADAVVARRAARDVVDRARDSENPLRGSHLRARSTRGVLDLTAQPRPDTSRDDLRMPDAIWDEVDVNIHRHLSRVPVLLRLRLGARRGILLHGPPGTGKTHLGRIIAAELAGTATTIVVDRSALACLEEVYVHAARLAPTVVLIEDIDTIAGRRGSSRDASLQALLGALDGPLDRDGCVITVATTNDVSALDEAAVRAARFDRVVEVPRPSTEGRRMILRRYAADLPEHDEINIEHLAIATDGATGSDLREIFRHALLATDGPLSTAVLAEAAKDRGFAAEHPYAAYL